MDTAARELTAALNTLYELPGPGPNTHDLWEAARVVLRLPPEVVTPELCVELWDWIASTDPTVPALAGWMVGRLSGKEA